LSILSVVLKTDDFIFSSIPRFQETLSTLQSENQSGRDRDDAALLIAKIKDIIRQIEVFRNETIFLRQAYHDLSKFLGKDARVRNQ